MILIYSDVITHRLTYIVNVVFKYILGVDFKITTQFDEFVRSDLAKLNYSNQKVANCVQVIPSKLLFEKGIKQQKIKVGWVNKVPFFFETEKDQYDMFASSFWMLTRYEEYLSFTPDIHDRFTAKESFAFQQGFLKKPVVNIWANILKDKIEEVFPAFEFPKKKTAYLNTLDIDIAFLYRGNSFWKFYGGFLRDVIKNKKKEVKLRLEFLKTKQDIYDTYKFIELCSKNVKTIYFFLLGDVSKYDFNVNPKKKVLKELIQRISKTHQIGIHPSYQSNQQPKQLNKEIQRLEKISNQKATISRQHFLKLKMPFTYEQLIQQNISTDYTMGYADELGFRAGVCNAYPFYNLKTEAQRPLWIVPFHVMDGTLNQYLKLTPEQSLEEIKYLVNEVREVNGVFVSLWHNSSLSEIKEWDGWRIVYQKMLQLMKQN